MLRELHLEKYRGFRSHKVYFGHFNLLLGQNNAGKSTIAEALRIVSVITSRFKSLTLAAPPDWLKDFTYYGVYPSMHGLDINFRSIFFMDRDPPAKITALLQNDWQIEIFIGPQQEVFAAVSQNGNYFTNSRTRQIVELPKIHAMAPIGPLSDVEKRLQKETIQKNLFTALSPNHFRNQVLQYPSYFDSFSDLVESTWKGVTLERPYGGIHGVEMWADDGSFNAEVGSVGHGFQIWLQILWFLTRTAPNSTVILDEPDVYLHADMQKKLMRLLRKLNTQVIVASHSAEIVSEFDAEETILVDKKKMKSTFANNEPDVQAVLNLVGSSHNIQLSRIALTRKVLILEGKDMDILDPIYSTLFPDEVPLKLVPNKPMGGGKMFERVIGSRSFLPSDMRAYCILDRDYRMDDEIANLQEKASINSIDLHVWQAKEIENFLLIPAVISRIIAEDTSNDSACDELAVEAKIFEIANASKESVFDAIANTFKEKHKDKDVGQANTYARSRIETIWTSKSGILLAVPGKEIVAELSRWAKSKYGARITSTRIARSITIDEIPDEVASIMSHIRSNRPFKLP